MSLNNRTRSGVYLLLAISLAGWASGGQRPTGGAGEDSEFPTPNAAEEARECGWEREAYAWIDTNTDGRPDAGERPLQGVVITASFIGGTPPEQPGAPTNAQGTTQWAEML